MRTSFSVVLAPGDLTPRLTGNDIDGRHQIKLDADGDVWMYATRYDLIALCYRLLDVAAAMPDTEVRP